jgi:glycosyltransferase involved in cell wall biosynthesis
MRLLMISGERGIPTGKKSPFWYTLELLREHFDRIDVLCPRTAAASPMLQPFANVFFHPSPWPLLLQPLWILQKGKELVSLHHHDAMTVHEYPPFLNGIGARWLFRKTGIPYAIEIHHIVGFPVTSSFREKIGRILSRLFLSIDATQSTVVRVVNRATVDVLAGWGIDKEKIRIVPSFYLDFNVLKPQPEAPKTYDVAFSGRLVENKGLLELIAALHPLSATLVVIGDGPLRGRAEALAAKLGMSGRVTFLGWLPEQDDVYGALKSAKVFVMNSRSEGGPRIALEAMACGMPVVATRVGIMPEVIRDGVNGILVPMEDAALTEAISLLLKDEGLRARIAEEALNAVQNYERKKAISAYAEFLQSVA